MNLRRTRPGEPSPEMVDAVIDGYVAWREHANAVAWAYGRWNRSAPAERESAYAEYVAALDREAGAAARYAWTIGRVLAHWADAQPGFTPVDRAA